MTTGHLKCEYLLIWLRNMQNCKMPKIDIFSQVRGHEKLQFFRLSEKAFKMMKITTRWLLDTWNVNICSFGWEICKTVKCPKMTIFRRSAVMKIFKFFDFLESLLKWWNSPPDDHWTLEMWNICSFGWGIWKTVKCPKLTFFRRSAVMKNFNFFDFLKRLLKWWKSPPVDHRTLEMWIFAHLGEKYAKLKCPKMTIFRRSAVMKIFKFFDFLKKLLKWWKSPPVDHRTLEMWIFAHWEICKTVKCPKLTFFSQVLVHEKLQFFRFSEKTFKMMKITTSWPQDTWNVNICSFGWEICKTVKCPKLTFFRRSAVMKIFNFFDFLKRLLKWWKSPPVDHRTLEMWIFARLGEKYAKLWNVQKWQFFAGPRSWKSSSFSTFWKVF